MKRLALRVIAASILFFPTLIYADVFDDDNAQTKAIAKDIKENGPPELQRLPLSHIENSVRNFVIAKRLGKISPSALERLGGIKGATEHVLQGQLKASGAR